MNWYQELMAEDALWGGSPPERKHYTPVCPIRSKATQAYMDKIDYSPMSLDEWKQKMAEAHRRSFAQVGA